jgi:pimeloyl-ACP methyl ester carboxylesterase
VTALALGRHGHGPALVLLHPLGADRRMWAPCSTASPPSASATAGEFALSRVAAGGHVRTWDDPEQVAAVLVAGSVAARRAG